jgi:hypothetical protein
MKIQYADVHLEIGDFWMELSALSLMVCFFMLLDER